MRRQRLSVGFPGNFGSGRCDRCRLRSDGDRCRLGSVGDWSRLRSCGDWCRLRRGGDWCRLRSCGNWSRLRSGGDGSRLRSGGDGCRLRGGGGYRSRSCGWLGRWSRSRLGHCHSNGRRRCDLAQCRIQGLGSHRSLKEQISGHPFGVGGRIVNRGENGFHPRQVRLDCFPESESVRRLKKDLRDKDVAPSVPIDPFHRIIGVCCGSCSCPAKGLERLRERFGYSGSTIYDQYFH